MRGRGQSSTAAPPLGREGRVRRGQVRVQNVWQSTVGGGVGIRVGGAIRSYGIRSELRVDMLSCRSPAVSVREPTGKAEALSRIVGGHGGGIPYLFVR